MKKKTAKGPPRNKPKSKPKPKPLPDLFPKIPAKVPARVQDAAELWLELFIHLSSLTSPEQQELVDAQELHTSSCPVTLKERRIWLADTAELSDFALELYEERWPHSGRKGD